MSPVDALGKRGPKPKPKDDCGRCGGSGFITSGVGAGTTCHECNGTGER